MIIESIRSLFSRDLLKLKAEIESYKNESKLWIVDGQIANSAGNLSLHLVGNLNTYIGNGLGNSGYVRDRDKEFSEKNRSKLELLQMIEETKTVVDRSLATILDDQLKLDFPIIVWEKPTNMAYTLMHLHGHLNYHLGQINYHRRLLDK